MTWAPSVMAALDGLIGLFGKWPDLTGVDVRLGPQVPTVSSARAIFVGDTLQPDSEGNPVDNAVDYQAVGEGMGTRQRETFMVHCSAASLNTNSDWHAAAVDAYALAGAAGAAIAAHPDLIHAIQGRATFGGGSLKFLKLDVGVKAVVLFDVDIESYTTG